MSQIEDDDSKPWTEHDLKEAIRRINAGEINFKDAENYYGISPRTIHRQRAIENMRAQLNPEKAKKLKAAAASTAKKDFTILRKPVEISCSSISDVVSLLKEGTEEVKQLLNYECDLIYECKVCKNLFRSLLNFISHKRIYCCDMYSVVHTLSDESGDAAMATNTAKVEEQLKTKENLKEFTSRPLRITCRKDLTTVLKRITTLSSEFVTADPLLHLQSMENTPYALQQTIRPSPHVNDPTVESSEMNTAGKKFTVSEVESKKEIIPTSLEKSSSISQEKIKSTSQHSQDATAIVKPFTVTEKRFKCPLCPSHFSTKKSVLRHLKSVHHKSEEQVEKLKSRVQVFLLKKKSVFKTSKHSASLSVPKQTTATSSSTPLLPKSPSTVPSTSFKEGSTSPSSSTRSDVNSEKGDSARDCTLCGRRFANRSTYTSHTRTCRKNISNDDDMDSTNASSVEPMSPVVSLIPINTSGRVSKNENNNSPIKKLAPVTSQKKVAAPPDSSLSLTSSSKKIGIQVRMNYRKDGVNQSASTAGSSPVGCTIPSGLSHTGSNNSRRSSTVSVNQDEKFESSEVDLLKGHNTRSTAKSKLAHILKSLLDKHSIKDENEDPKSTAVMRRVEKNEMSVYCEDCKTAYALNDQRWDSENGSRIFKCALQDCDFRSNSKNELLPHLSAQHMNLSETAMAELDSFFIAESSGVGKFCCHKENSREQLLESRKRNTAGKSRGISAPNSASTKRKLNSESNDKSAKRKMAISLKTEFAAGAPTVGFKTDDKTAAIMWRNTNNNHKKVVLKKIREEHSRSRTRKRVIVDTIGLQNVISNRLQTTVDEPSQFTTAKTLKKQNLLLGEMKVASKLPKMNTLVDSTLLPLTSGDIRAGLPSKVRSPFLALKDCCYDLVTSSCDPNPNPIYTSSTRFALSLPVQYTDLDPATMSEENLKKSVMTIIFGKDVPDENADANIVDNHEKSPDSSSTSSDGGKEKRYGLRAGKPVMKKVIAPSLPENRDDKVLKIQTLNKMKSASR